MLTSSCEEARLEPSYPLLMNSEKEREKEKERERDRGRERERKRGRERGGVEGFRRKLMVEKKIA